MSEADVRAALDECLEAIGEGVPLDEALARYPKLGAELRPLVEQASLLRSLRRAPGPRAARREADRMRYLMRAAEFRRRRRKQGPLRRALRWLGGAGAPTGARLAQGLTSFALALIVFGGLTAWAAVGAGADSPLYGVKLGIESARQSLATGDEARAELALGYLETRHRELRDVIADGGAPSGRLLGRMERNADDAVRLAAETGRRDLLARAATIIEEQTRLVLGAGPRLDGDAAERLAQILDSGRAQHDFVTRLMNVDGALETRLVSGSPVEVKLDTARRISSGPVALEQQSGKAIVKVGGQTYPVASGVQIAPGGVSSIVVADGRDGVSYVIAANTTSDSSKDTTRVVGRVAEATSADLRVGDQRILIDDKTIILKGKVGAGKLVAVEGVPDGNGNVRAAQIEVLPENDQGTVTTYRGVVTKRDGTLWTVDGRSFSEGRGAEIDLKALDPGNTPIGAVAQLDAIERADGTRSIRRLVVLPPLAVSGAGAPDNKTAAPVVAAPSSDVWRVEGVVTELKDAILTLRDGTRARIGADTQVIGQIAGGARVAVELRRGADGVASAISIQVLTVAEPDKTDKPAAIAPQGASLDPILTTSPAP